MLTPEEAVAPIRSGMRVFVHGAAATPTPLLDALAARTDLDGVTLYHLHLEGRVTVAEPEYAGRFRCNSLFTGAALRGAVNEGRADFTPIFLSDIPSLFTSGRVPLDAALMQLSPPDKHGYCTVGTSADTAVAAAARATASSSSASASRFPRGAAAGDRRGALMEPMKDRSSSGDSARRRRR
jgi:acyl-CoA hydrolase